MNYNSTEENNYIPLGAMLNVLNQLMVSRSGRILLFCSQLCNCGPGALLMRDNKKLYATESEKSLFAPQVIKKNT